jgi:hypothetical protein
LGNVLVLVRPPAKVALVDVRKNKLLLIQSLLLDLIGFSLIFPLVPAQYS